VWNRTAVTLSFARAQGRNYRQLPARARSREKPSPADILYSVNMVFPGCKLGARCFFPHGSTSPKVTRVRYARWQQDRNGWPIPAVSEKLDSKSRQNRRNDHRMRRSNALVNNCDGYVPVGTAIASCPPGGRRYSHHCQFRRSPVCQPHPRNMWETHRAGDIHDKYNLTGNGHSP
jgi:hypothetical protein